ncbi:TfoX/Sxy family protein [Dongia sp.]|uniref:TfoX/Sxy family protein n=1 Tax=Dongia sp. TaxID=1977262 RepID=UPI00375133CF
MPKPPSLQQKLVDEIDAKLAPLGHFRARPMFGGYGLYLDGVIFGLVAWDRLWLRVDDRSRPDFEQAGMPPFAYSRGGASVSLSYFRCPDPVLGDSAKLRKWVREARRASVERPKPRRKRPPAGRSRNPARS